MSVPSRIVDGLGSRARRWDLSTAARRGRWLGRLVHRLDRRHRRVALRNLALAFPDRDEAWRKAVARAAFEQLGRTVAEVLWSPRLADVDLDTVTTFDGLEHVEEALRAGRGAIIASAHYGNWELMALAVGSLGIPLTSIARPLDDPDLDERLIALRTRTGNRVLPKARALRGALAALRSNSALAILSDQNTLRDEAVFVPFFGRLAATTPVIAHLHLRTGAPILPGFVIPEGDRYHTVFEAPLVVESGDRREAVVEITASITRRIEHYVRRHPEAWLWLHDRWRERP